MFFCLFACLVICDCMLDTVVSFTLLSAGYFCIPISLVEFCFGIQLNYVELIFWVLLLCFVRQGQSSFQSRAVHSPLLSECCAQCPPKYNGFPSAWREQARPQPCVSAWHCCSGTEGRSASSPWGLLQVPRVLSAQRSPLWYPVLQTLSALVFADSPLHPHNSRESVWLHLISSSLL